MSQYYKVLLIAPPWINNYKAVGLDLIPSHGTFVTTQCLLFSYLNCQLQDGFNLWAEELWTTFCQVNQTLQKSIIITHFNACCNDLERF